MKVLFVWSGLSGYMGDCWRELARRPGIELKVAVDLGETYYGGSFKAEDVLRDLDWSERLPENWRPEVIFTVGWRNHLCRSAALLKSWERIPKVCCFDMPWRWQIRCLVARFVLRGYVKRFAAALVPGKVADRYARWLGFPKVFHGLFSTNLNRFKNHRGGGGFLFVGRDSPDKGTDVLRQAHTVYQAKAARLGRPVWPLRIVSGMSPDALGAVYRQADCFVLASRWDPWGVVLAEAAAAGLPIICTDACGARKEVVREGVNGFVVSAGSVGPLAEAMLNVSKLDGAVGRQLAAPYGCAPWAERIVQICRELGVG